MASSEQTQARQLEDIRLILKDFLKVIKIVAMYPEGNPLPQSMRGAFVGRMTDLVADCGELDFRINAESLLFHGETVFTDKSRDESLAGLFFESGINRLTFQDGLAVNDLYKLLDAIKTYQNADHRNRDLVAVLWEAALQKIVYETVEDVALKQYDGELLLERQSEINGPSGYSPTVGVNSESYEAIFSQSEDVFSDTDSRLEVGFLPSDSGKVPTVENVLSTGDAQLDSALNISQASEAMGLADPAPAPQAVLNTDVIVNDEHRLSEEEVEQVELMLRRDAEFDEFESTCELVKELLHQEPEMHDFYETVTLGERVLAEFLKAGKLTFATDLLRYFAAIEDKLRTEKPVWAERLKEARIVAGGRDRLAILCRMLNENSEIGSIELRRYLDNFDWEALVAITDLMGDLQHGHHRETVQDYLTLRGRDRVHIVAKGLQDRRIDVACASIAILSRIGTDETLSHLSKVVGHREVEVRRRLVLALVECPSDACISILKKLTGDADPSVRRAAVNSIVQRRGPRAFEALSEIVNDEKFGLFEEDDQRAILVAYSKLGSDEAVDFLVQLVEKVNPFRKHSFSILRQAAFEALAHNQGEKAESALIRLSASWRPEVKEQAKAAIRKRREFIYGGGND
jgi:hypothetical protein